MEFEVLINDDDYTDYVPLPLSEQLTLDDSLDYGFLKLVYTEEKEPFEPLSNVNIKITKKNNKVVNLDYFVSSDEVTQDVQNDKYSHNIMLIEQTKWLERFMCRTRPITNPLIHEFEETKIIAQIKDNLSGNIENRAIVNLTPQIPETKTWNSAVIFFGKLDTVNNGYIKLFKDGILIKEIPNSFDDLVYDFTDGTYKFEYHIESGVGQIPAFSETATFYLDIIPTMEARPNKSISQVVEDVLLTCETLKEKDTPLFTFNEQQKEEFKNIESPEFTLTGTLWEQLLQIGTYIHCIPRLKNKVIYFDKLGGNDKTLYNLEDYVSEVKKFDIEQYATSLDSNVDNFTNLNDYKEGSIIEPFEQGYKTLRTESAVVKITDENCIIETKYPIEKIIDLKVGWCKTKQLDSAYVGSIIQWVYESAEYNTLSSTTDNYPLSKGYAIKYTEGQKNITELSFKLPNSVSPVFSDYAIVNIINRKLGSIITGNEMTNSIQDLQFEVTYIPMISARIKQYKTYLGDFKNKSTLAFNQSAQKISSKSYGEAMKGAIARLGNPEITKVYLFDEPKNIRVGDLYDEDYYISVVKNEYHNNFVKTEIGLSKNFNKYNEYVGIKNDIRFYEISEKQIVDSQVVYEDFCIVGDDFKSDNDSLIGNISYFAKEFTNELTNIRNVTLARVEGYTKDNKALTEVALPVNSYGVGNTLLLNFKYDDNFSAGITRQKVDGTNLQYQVRYTDLYGELDKLHIELGYATNGNVEQIDSFETAVKLGNELPLTDYLSKTYFFYPQILTNRDNKILLKKENREVTNFNYMLHFITNRKSLILGSAITNKCFLTNNVNYQYYVKFLTEEIDKFGNWKGLAYREIQIPSYNVNFENSEISFGDIRVPDGITKPIKAWALITNGEVVFGENKELKANDVIKLPKMTFTHKI